MDIEILNIGLIDYEYGLNLMREIHKRACQEHKKNYLILCQHNDVYTVGYNERREFGVKALRTDRGGSIVFHAPGQQIFYFVFRVRSQMIFLRKVINSFYEPLKNLDKRITYINKMPGFYIEKRKLGFLGFRFENGYSIHGVAINYDVDIDKFNLIDPCGLTGYTATSLVKEGINIGIEELIDMLVNSIKQNFR